ncbi:MAG: RnfABCDGE type electron transport complex subunit D [Oscillospiraceae bacterium]
MKLLTVTSSPHLRDNSSTSTIMRDVLIALLPAVVASVLIFKVSALLVILTCVICAVGSEFVWEKLMHLPVTIGDLSAAVTGTLLAMCLPADLPLWMAGLGSVIAIIVIKQLFGGIGQNFANPAITARVILLISFGQMATFTYDGVSTATPMMIMNGAEGTLPGVQSMLLGTHGGSLGETCAVALLVGGVYLLVRKVISWHIPVCFIGTVLIGSLIAGISPLHALTGGGLLLGAIFMATDYSTSPMSKLGKIIYGVGCGLLTLLIRIFGTLPEGVSYAILLMNILTPHIDKLTQQKAMGGTK